MSCVMKKVSDYDQERPVTDYRPRDGETQNTISHLESRNFGTYGIMHTNSLT